ncbi:hypothetical protein ACFQ0X_21000 [Streptomyces rectiviolaceus]|uniref:Uncharacterized protein n=1 Tax=Streptomyces rectiviolaceus TaxID=332591 RepID=A0ABP6NKR4_9ACTN
MITNVLSAISESAREQRQSNCGVYSVVVPLTTCRPENPESTVQDEVSRAIHLIEDEGWSLDRLSTFASTTSHLSDGRVLLVFRRAKHTPPENGFVDTYESIPDSR